MCEIIDQETDSLYDLYGLSEDKAKYKSAFTDKYLKMRRDSMLFRAEIASIDKDYEYID